MKHPYVIGILLSLFLMLALTACDKSNVPPPPITLEELSPALEKAFAKATGETKDLASQIANELKAPDYPKAYANLQMLSGKSGLTKEQVGIVSRGLLCLNNVLQTAQANGDPKAAQILHLQRTTK